MENACCTPKRINDLENTFDRQRAEKEARTYLERGTNKRIKKLLASFQDQSSKPFTVLDIGCGVGAAHFELLKNGLVLDVVGVEASSSYIASAKQIADSLKLAERVRYTQMDFAQSFDSVESADIVILDRVICCYPDLENLLAPAAARARRYLALSYPREDWWVELFYRLTNSIRWLKGNEFFTYIHSHTDVYRITLQKDCLRYMSPKVANGKSLFLRGKNIKKANRWFRTVFLKLP